MVSACTDDALGDLDAVGVVEALAEAYEAYDRARRQAAAPRAYGGYFDGAPTYV